MGVTFFVRHAQLQNYPPNFGFCFLRRKAFFHKTFKLGGSSTVSEVFFETNTMVKEFFQKLDFKFTFRGSLLKFSSKLRLTMTQRQKRAKFYEKKWF